MCEVFGQAVECGILFFEETFNVGREFIFVAEEKVVGMEEDFLRVGFGESDLALHGDEHCRGLGNGRSRGGLRLRLEGQGNGFNAEYFAGENSVTGGWVGDDFVIRFGEEFVNGGGGEFLLDAVAGGSVFDRGDGDDVNGFG